MSEPSTQEATGKKRKETLHETAERLVASTREVMLGAQTEEDLRIGIEKLLDPLIKSIGIEPQPRYERLGAKSVYQGRPDAVHGQVIVEYEAPDAFVSERAVIHAHEQLVDYMRAEALASQVEPLAAVQRIKGVGLDGNAIFFVRYQPEKIGKAIDVRAFVRDGPYALDAESARTFLTYLRALARLPLTAENLAARFGPKSKIAPLAVSALADGLEHWANERVRVFFGEWQRLFGIVYGEQFGQPQAAQAQALAQLYQVRGEPDFQELLFCVHTYFALLIKLIAVEIVALQENTFTSSFTSQLTHVPKQEFLYLLTEMEDGGVYAKRGITNFLEGDFFRWYLDAFSPRLEQALREIARGLADFEPATTALAPESSRDLLKKLYQYLVPQQVRHKLGEYYTPDWLAELTLDEVGYDGDTRARLLDPACGSGTFLVLAIQRARAYARAHKERRTETAKRIAANVWGFDLNPLAVIASRTNYLFALGDLAQKLSSFEIPVYLADSLLWPEKSGQLALRAAGETIEVQTSVQTFVEALAQLKAEGLVYPSHEQVVASFYRAILDLEAQGKNSIWSRFIKNMFAPTAAGEFDFVVGNPPWIRWGYLSYEYRQATLPLWQSYGLFSLKGHAARLGGGEKDFSMLFTYGAVDYYLKKGGKLGFLITQEVFKSKGAGEGFRRFRLDQRDRFKVLKAHDLVSVQPFEGAANKTALIVLEKGRATTYPVPYTVWTRKKGIGKIPTDTKLKEAKRFLEKRKLSARPVGTPTGSWQTIAESQKGLGKIQGANVYQARLGARVEPYGVFWLELRQVLAGGNLLVRNLVERGKRNIQQVVERVEPDLIFPAVRGADIQRWRAAPAIYVLMCQDPQTSEPYPQAQMKSEWPWTFSYLTRFKDVLLSRGSKTVRQLAERTEFYAMFGIGAYTVARYKVVWKRMASDLVAAVISQHKTPFGFKTVIPTDTTSLFALDNADEAHYLCAVLNAASVREFIKSYSSAGRGFGTPSVMQNVGIPKFDGKNKLHQRLVQLSKTLHDRAAQAQGEEMAKLEAQVDDAVRKLFGVIEI